MKWALALVAFLPGCWMQEIPQSYVEAGQKRCEKNGGAVLYSAYNITKPTAQDSWSTGSVTCADGAVFNDVTTRKP